MNINKENSPTWVKVTIWVTIFAFVFGFIAIGLFQLISDAANNKNNTTQTTTTSTTQSGAATVASINNQYQATALSIEPLVKQDPTNKDQLVSLASTYMQWGSALMQLNDSQAQTLALEKMNLAKENWAKAYEIDPTDKEVAGDYATTLYYTNDVTKAIEVAEKVVKDNPQYSTVWYNLGIFYADTDKDKAINALEQAVKYETDATAKKSAQDMLNSLKSSK